MREERHYQGNPQKNSPALGATLAFLGINGLLALLHGSQGCSTFIRLQLSRHYKEPIPLNSTALQEDSAIFGGWDQLKKGIGKVMDKYQPQIVGVMSSGLTETFGDDMTSALASLHEERPELRPHPVVLVSAPDYIGSMQEGYQRTVLALLSTLLPAPTSDLNSTFAHDKSAVTGMKDAADPATPIIALFPGCHLSPSDIDELKDIMTLFGLHPVVLPDLSTSLDGHLELEPAPVVQGGTTLEEISLLPQAVAAFSFGLSMHKAGQYLEENYHVPHYNFPSLTGLSATDALIMTLAGLTKQPVPAKLSHQRSQLLDTLADYHDQLGGKQIALALETDLLYSLATALIEVGAEVPVALAASPNEIKNFPTGIPVQVGDLEELEELAGATQLIIANSNGRQAAAALNRPHLRAGLPVFDRAGYPQKIWIGYRGTQNFIFDVLNTLAV
ncbi:MAG: nitrogenase iron-molybdenum cofactor biosynthesis protein NifN [Desulfitobacteriaceae bacterium]|nr:nitrogenase iron-molybdenum cofactor biosynthesis protein NifN [Desulfitobacteriaceae bacterium]MDI6878185.1 nitrogenase iron-molybdenum cofactor biosynthesis protein NifN [Desulfitobacteriaceae bacterium]MDI6913502.1 nitrogenase iron-molybdenum cofactor biosynthesis protein NifN [Desulfitobacteriaceae bacterium]